MLDYLLTPPLLFRTTPQTAKGATVPGPNPNDDETGRKKEFVFKPENARKCERSCGECSRAHRAVSAAGDGWRPTDLAP